MGEPFRPRGLLLDFGGVIVESERSTDRPAELVDRVQSLVDGQVTRARIEVDLVAAGRAYSRWRDAVSRNYAPLELTHAQLWGDWVASDWPAPARAAVVAEATALTYQWFDRGNSWRLRDGVTDLLDLATAGGIPMAIVSNTACGASFRDFLTRAGVGDRFQVQVYSDELGARKPNPAMVTAATDALGVAPADTWFVGDTLWRDTLCARRAGVGCAILVRSDRDRPVAEDGWLTPDVFLHTMREDITCWRACSAGKPVEPADGFWQADPP